jgi:ureidoacrylate peracid hydrolase
MPAFEIPTSLVERCLTLRGRVHPFEKLDPLRTAFVVIDMQNVFVAEGSVYEVPAARHIVGAINRLAGAVRRRGGAVAWVQMTFDPADPWPTFYKNMLSPLLADRFTADLTPGSAGHALCAALDVHDGDMIVRKTRFSAFLPNSSDISTRLRARGIDTVLVGGTVTNICCDCSARDAMMMDFKTVMVTDCNAGFREELHAGALRNFIQVLGDVRSSDEAIALLERGGAARSAAE